tara:strand:+ start:1108 stop:1749 length:642 start_codon:yes stop_codon:yes gene_type:complete
MSKGLPLVKSNKGDSGSFLGYKECKIYEFTDDSNESFATWSNVFLNILLHVKGSSFERKMAIKGTWEYDDNGNVVDCSLMRKIRRLLDAIGCLTIGINVKGEWQTLQGDVIEDIGSYLNKEYVDNPVDDNYPYIGYMFKKQPRPGKTKVYTECYPFLVKDTDEGKTELREHIDWCKKNGNLKEYDPNTPIEPVVTEEIDDDLPYDASDLPDGL